MSLLGPTLKNGAPTPAAKTALIYITVGTLTMVWTAVYFIYQITQEPEANVVSYYWIGGFMMTGLVLLLIGLASRPSAPPAVHPSPPVPPQQASANPVLRPSTLPHAQPAPAADSSVVEVVGMNGQTVSNSPGV